MCQVKPGPRCASHLKKSIDSLATRVEEISKIRQQNGNTPALDAENAAVVAELKEAKFQYMGTPTGRKEVDEKIAAMQARTDVDERVKERHRLSYEGARALAIEAYDSKVTARKLADKIDENNSQPSEYDDKIAIALKNEKDLDNQIRWANRDIKEYMSDINNHMTQVTRLENEKLGAFQGSDEEKSINDNLAVHFKAIIETGEKIENEKKFLRQAPIKKQIAEFKVRELQALKSSGLSTENLQSENYGVGYTMPDGGTSLYVLHAGPRENQGPAFVRVMGKEKNDFVLENGQKINSDDVLASEVKYLKVPEEVRSETENRFVLYDITKRM